MGFEILFAFRFKKKKIYFLVFLVLALLSHILIYYYNVFAGMYPRVLWLVCVALFMMVLGYLFGRKWRIVVRDRFHIREQEREYSIKTLRLFGVFFCLIGIFAHVFYYSRNSISSYSDSYTVGRGSGYITVFFLIFGSLEWCCWNILAILGKTAYG